MAYSEIKVIAGGLAHIPIIIGFFYFVQNKIFAERTISTKNATPTPSKNSKSPTPSNLIANETNPRTKDIVPKNTTPEIKSSQTKLEKTSSSTKPSSPPSEIDPIKKNNLSEAKPDKNQNSDPTMK